MEKTYSYVSLDERDLAELIEAYSKRFYGIIDKYGAEGCYTDAEMHDIIKKLASFVREYEELREKNKKAAKPTNTAIGAIAREVKGA